MHIEVATMMNHSLSACYKFAQDPWLSLWESCRPWATERQYAVEIRTNYQSKNQFTALPTTKSVQNMESLLPSPPHSGHLSHWRGKSLYQIGKQFDKRKLSGIG